MPNTKTSWSKCWMYLALFVVVFAYLPFCVATGLADLMISNLSLEGVLFPILFGAGVALILVLPIEKLVVGELQVGTTRSVRVFTLMALTSPPLIGLGYFLGGVSDLINVHELVLMVFPATAIASILYDDTKKPWVFGSLLYFLTAPSFFFINDILSQFHVPWYYHSNSAAFYLWRSFFPALGVWGTLVVTSRSGVQRSAKETRKNFAIGLIALSFYALSVRLVVPFAVAIKQGLPFGSLVTLDYWWVAYLICAVLLLRPLETLGSGLMILFSVIYCVIVAIKVFELSISIQADFWTLSLFTHLLFVLGVFLWLALNLSKELLQKRTS